MFLIKIILVPAAIILIGYNVMLIVFDIILYWARLA